MSSELRECSIGDLVSIKHGFAFSGEHISKDHGKCVLVTPGNFEIGGGFKEGNAKYFHGPYPEEYVFAPGDLIVTMTDLSKTADTLGYSAKIPREECKIYLHNQRVGKVIAKSSDANLDFLYWVMRHKDYRNLVVSTATGSTVRHTSPSRILAYSFLLPPPSQQQAIAHILGTLDDKIELNRKTNETLEAMAKALFKSWFVDFDPVRAKAEGRPTGLPAEISDLFPDSFEDSELGEIPSGWRVGCLSDCCEITMGQSPPGDTYNEDGDGLPFYQGKTDFGFRFPGRRVYCSSPTRQASIGATLISVRAPVGSANIAREVCSIGRGIAALKSRQSADSFIYYLIGTLQGVFESYNSEGTVFGAINGKDLASIQVVAPSAEAIAAFNSQCLPMDESIQSNTLETEHLTTIREPLKNPLKSIQIQD